MTGPLAGLHVVDCSSGTAGPRVTGILADYGADVVWVEPPGGDRHRDELAVPYSVYNRGKRSVVLDLHDDDDWAEFDRLLAGADVLVTSGRPGSDAKLGLDHDTLHAVLPGLVTCRITGFGAGSAQAPDGYESLVSAAIGAVNEASPERSNPTRPAAQGMPFASTGAAYLAAVGVLAAVHRRAVDLCGRHVETSLLDGALAYLAMTWCVDDSASPRVSNRGRRLVVGKVRCADGEYLGVHTGATGAFDRLMAVLGLAEHFPVDPVRPAMGIAVDDEQQRLLDEEVPAIFARRPRAEWVELLREADVCAVPDMRPTEAFDEPQTRHNGLVVRVDDPMLGPVDQVGPAATFRGSPLAVLRAAPRIGEHGVRRSCGWAAEPWQDPRSGGQPRTDVPLLDGVRILDIGAYYAGPFGPRLLADLGADVIKVETLVGDQLRPMQAVFASAAAGKRAMSVDMKLEDGRDIARGLVDWCDVVTHNMRPGAAERLGVGYEQICERNPQAVYLHAPGWGGTGPDQNRQSFAPMLSGYVGAAYETAGVGNPPISPVGNEDPGNGLASAFAVLAALVYRQRTGHGQLVEAPQLAAALGHMSHIVRTAEGVVLGAGLMRPDRLGTGALDRLYETADGWLALVAATDEHLVGLGSFVGCDLSADRRFGTRADRRANDDALAELIAGALRHVRTADAVHGLRRVGVPVTEASGRNASTFLREPAHEASGRVACWTHPTRGTVREIDQLIRVSDAAVPVHRRAPELGEHTTEILSMLGYSPEQVAALRTERVVR